MRNGLNKFAKGMFAIFTIKILIFSLIFLNQACSDDENIEISSAENNFLESLLISRENLTKVKASQNKFSFINNSSRTTNNNIVELKLTKTDPNLQIEIYNFNQALNSIASGDLENEEGSECINNTGDHCLTVYVDEDEVTNSLSSSIQAARNYLKAEYDLTDYEISGVLDGNDEVVLVNMAQVIIEAKIESNNPIDYIESLNLFSQPLYAAVYQESKAWGCFKSVIGVDIAISAFDALMSEYKDDVAMSIAERQARKNGAKAALKRLAFKFASKLVGGIGAVVAVVEFGLCMMK